MYRETMHVSPAHKLPHMVVDDYKASLKIC